MNTQDEQDAIANAATGLAEMNARSRPLLPTWFLLFTLLLGVVASVVGYIGCFSVVQSTQKSTGPLSWLCLEAALSLLRMYTWGLNPEFDNAPPLELVLQLDEEPPLPTCNMYSDYIEKDNLLPLTRANQFLNAITSFAGLVKRFDHPDLTLYYTFARKRGSIPNDETMLGKRVLYIAVFDHKERTTRVYTWDDMSNGFYAIEAGIPTIDLEHGIVEAKLGKKIDSKNDPIIGVQGIRSRLEEHYQSIVDPYSTIRSAAEDHRYRIENRWTMKRADTTSGPQQERGAGTARRKEGALAIMPGQEAKLHDTDTSSGRDLQYLEQGRIERMLGMFYTLRGKWVENYMAFVIRETRERFVGAKTMVRRVDGEALANSEQVSGKQRATSGAQGFASDSLAQEEDRESERVEMLLLDEWHSVEKLLVYEVEIWEAQLWDRTKKFVGGYNVLEEERLVREWRANCWKRLDANTRAMDARIDAADTKTNEKTSEQWQHLHDKTRRFWQFVFKRFVEDETPSLSPSMRQDRLDWFLQKIPEGLPSWLMASFNATQQQQLQRHSEEMANRLRRELEDMKERLDQGLEQCSEFWGDATLVECRYSKSEMLVLNKSNLKAPLGVYSRELKQNKNFIYIHFELDSDGDYRWVADTIRDMPWVTTIYVPDPERLPDIQRDTPLFINKLGGQEIGPFLYNDSHLARSQGTFIFFCFTPTIAVSFVGPTSSNLILRLRHRATHPDTTLTVEGTSFQLTIPSLLTSDDVTLHHSPSKPGQLFFNPGIRNNLIIQVVTTGTYVFHDIQLLDEVGNRYDPASRNSDDVCAEPVRCVRFSMHLDPLQSLMRRDLL